MNKVSQILFYLFDFSYTVTAAAAAETLEEHGNPIMFPFLSCLNHLMVFLSAHVSKSNVSSLYVLTTSCFGSLQCFWGYNVHHSLKRNKKNNVISTSVLNQY
jgi:hypothetical protein